MPVGQGAEIRNFWMRRWDEPGGGGIHGNFHAARLRSAGRTRRWRWSWPRWDSGYPCGWRQAIFFLQTQSLFGNLKRFSWVTSFLFQWIGDFGCSVPGNLSAKSNRVGRVEATIHLLGTRVQLVKNLRTCIYWMCVSWESRWVRLTLTWELAILLFYFVTVCFFFRVVGGTIWTEVATRPWGLQKTTMWSPKNNFWISRLCQSSVKCSRLALNLTWRSLTLLCWCELKTPKKKTI